MHPKLLKSKIARLDAELEILALHETALQEVEKPFLDECKKEHERLKESQAEDLKEVQFKSAHVRRNLKQAKLELEAAREKEPVRQSARALYPWYKLQEQGDFFIVSEKPTSGNLRQLAANFQSRLGGN